MEPLAVLSYLLVVGLGCNLTVSAVPQDEGVYAVTLQNGMIEPVPLILFDADNSTLWEGNLNGTESIEIDSASSFPLTLRAVGGVCTDQEWSVERPEDRQSTPFPALTREGDLAPESNAIPRSWTTLVATPLGWVRGNLGFLLAGVAVLLVLVLVMGRK